MQQTNMNEKLKKCFHALGLKDNKAFDVLFAEMVRIELDERTTERKSVTVNVSDENQKSIAETIILLIKSQRAKGQEFSFEPNCINVEVANSGQTQQDSDRMIDFLNFDYDKEREKLVRRYNGTIIGNSQIRQVLLKENEETIEKMRDYDSQYQQEIAEIEQEIDDLEYKVQDYEDSVFFLFHLRKLREATKRIDQLTLTLCNCEERYENERSYKSYSYRKTSARISGLVEKEKKLQGVKHIFTGVKEQLIEGRDENGNITITFVPINTEQDNRTFQKESELLQE